MVEGGQVLEQAPKGGWSLPQVAGGQGTLNNALRHRL